MIELNLKEGDEVVIVTQGKYGKRLKVLAGEDGTMFTQGVIWKHKMVLINGIPSLRPLCSKCNKLILSEMLNLGKGGLSSIKSVAELKQKGTSFLIWGETMEITDKEIDDFIRSMIEDYNGAVIEEGDNMIPESSIRAVLKSRRVRNVAMTIIVPTAIGLATVAIMIAMVWVIKQIGL
jgi:hypothetical protein